MRVKSKCDTIVDDILSRVINHVYAAGDQLPTEKALCAEYEVSRVTIRESLKKLEMMDVISIEQGRGTYVKGVGLGHMMQPMFNLIDFGDFDVRTIYDARLYIETGTCRLAAVNCSKEDLLALEKIVQKMDETNAAGSGKKPMDLQGFDRQFHIRVAMASKNEILKAAVTNLENISASCAKRLNKSRLVMQDVVEDHRKILEAIRASDPDLAERAIREHTLRSEVFLE